MTIGAYTIKVEDSLSKTVDEEYTNTGGEVAYTIASGLTAFLNITDYDYKNWYRNWCWYNSRLWYSD